MNSLTDGRPPARKRTSGFTLIELLVVIAIISILAAILFPVFHQAREAARRSTCASNLRQLAIAASAYAQDYDELLPCAWDGGGVGVGGDSGSGGWMKFSAFLGPAQFDPALGSLHPYVKNARIFQCPSDRTRYGNSYALNGLLTISTPQPGFHAGMHLAALTSPSQTFLFVEESAQVPDDTTDDGYLNVSLNPITRRHQDGAVYAYADGHVRSHRYRSVKFPDPAGQHRFEP